MVGSLQWKLLDPTNFQLRPVVLGLNCHSGSPSQLAEDMIFDALDPNFRSNDRFWIVIGM